MNEYRSPFVNALAERWVRWKPLVESAVEKMPLMVRTMVRSAIDTFDIYNRMPEILQKLDDDPGMRIMVEGEIKALALEIDKEPPPLLKVETPFILRTEEEPPLIEKEEVPEPIPEVPVVDPLPKVDEPPSEEEEAVSTEDLEPTFEVPEEAAPIEPVHEVKFKKKKKRKKKAKNDT